MRRSVREDEFREFYERSNDRAVAVARRLVGSSVLAEDLAAEALARTYARWSKVRTHPNPEAWLFKVLGNLCVDHVRRAARRPELVVDLAEHGGGAEESVLRLDLAEALGRLSPRQQEVVVLRHVIDLSEEDVALTLGMSTGAVKTHLHRATSRLRADLAGTDLDLTRTTAEIDLTEEGRRAALD